MPGAVPGAVPGLVEAAVLVRDGELTSVALVERVLGRIEAAEGRLGAFVAVLADRALDEAAALDAECARGRLRGQLHGVPFAVKDLVDVAGEVTAAGSPKLAANVAAADAEVVARLRRAGAVVVGKTRTHEFAYGVLTPGTANPWDPERIAGGSSGGSAAAVAAGLVPFAIGSDTAGSIRIPAACCGVVGLKPTYGVVPTAGVVPLSWSCDHVGPIAPGVAEAVVLFEALSGVPAGTRAPVPPDSLRLGRVVGEDLVLVDPAVSEVLDRLCGRLEMVGARIDEVELPLGAARSGRRWWGGSAATTSCSGWPGWSKMLPASPGDLSCMRDRPVGTRRCYGGSGSRRDCHGWIIAVLRMVRHLAQADHA